MTERHEHAGSDRRGGGKPVLWAFLAIAIFFLLTEHRAHLFGALPYLLLLACPLMHLYMHRGHGGHARHRQDRSSSPVGGEKEGGGVGGAGREAQREERGSHDR